MTRWTDAAARDIARRVMAEQGVSSTRQQWAETVLAGPDGLPVLEQQLAQRAAQRLLPQKLRPARSVEVPAIALVLGCAVGVPLALVGLAALVARMSGAS